MPREQLAGRNSGIASNEPVEASTDASVKVVVAILLAICWVMLTHQWHYIESERLSVEGGAGFQEQQKFEADIGAASWNVKAGFVGIAVIGLYCFLTAPRETAMRFSVTLFLLMLFLTWLFASVLWSANVQQTTRELIRIAVYGFTALALARRFAARDFCQVLIVMLAGSVLFACAADVLTGNFRLWQSSYRMHGTLHSNLLASQAMVVVLGAVAMTADSKRRTFWLTLALAMLSVIVLSKTRGALLSVIVGIAAIQLLQRSARSLVLAGSLLVSGVALAGIALSFGSTQLQSGLGDAAKLGRTDDVGTLTGRVPLWNTILFESRDHRWMGYGYGAFWTTARTQKLANKLEWYPRHSHSAYFQTMVDLGYVGVFLLGAVVLAALAKSLVLSQATGNPAYMFTFGLLTAGIVNSIVEVGFVHPRELGLFSVAAILGLCVQHPVDEHAHATDETEAVADSIPQLNYALPQASLKYSN